MGERVRNVRGVAPLWIGPVARVAAHGAVHDGREQREVGGVGQVGHAHAPRVTAVGGGVADGDAEVGGGKEGGEEREGVAQRALARVAALHVDGGERDECGKPEVDNGAAEQVLRVELGVSAPERGGVVAFDLLVRCSNNKQKEK